MSLIRLSKRRADEQGSVLILLEILPAYPDILSLLIQINTYDP